MRTASDKFRLFYRMFIFAFAFIFSSYTSIYVYTKNKTLLHTRNFYSFSSVLLFFCHTYSKALSYLGIGFINNIYSFVLPNDFYSSETIPTTHNTPEKHNDF